jgi:uncharacterized repeat protein (TIGR01451 family)
MYSGFRSPTPTTVPQAAALAARPALRRRVVATLIALAAICVLIPLQRASAADITGKVTTTASVKSGTYGEWSSIRVDVTFKVASANTGDTFTMPLDKMLDARRFVSMDLKDANGAVVAKVTIKKDASGAPARDAAGNAILVFTFTNYVVTHDNLSGSAWFWITFDHSRVVVPTGTTTMNTTVYGRAITINGTPGPVGDEYIKFGNWRSPNNNEAEATALNPDGTSANPGPDITWTIQLQGGAQNKAPGWTRVTITDTPAAGSHFECPLNPAPSSIRKDTTTTLDRWVNTTVPKITVSACSRTSLTLVVTKAATDNNIYRIRFVGWIDGAPLPTTFGNTAQLRYEMPSGDTFTNPVSTSISRVNQGGNATGTPGPIILPPSPPKLVITKRPLAKVAKTGQTMRWQITVKNTGKVTVKNLKVCDILRDDQAFASTTVTYTIGTVKKAAHLVVSAGQGCIAIPSLGAGKRALIVVRTSVPSTARVRVRNTATVRANLVKLISANAKVPVIKVKGKNIPSPAG